MLVDFLVLTTVPYSTPLEVYGNYWHEGELGSRDKLRNAQIESALRGQANDLVILWQSDLENQVIANQTILELFGSNK